MKTTNKSPWTNAVGILMLVFAGALYGAQFFIDLKEEVEDTSLAYIAIAGLIVWLGFSDQAFKAFFDRFNSKK